MKRTEHQPHLTKVYMYRVLVHGAIARGNKCKEKQRKISQFSKQKSEYRKDDILE